MLDRTSFSDWFIHFSEIHILYHRISDEPIEFNSKIYMLDLLNILCFFIGINWFCYVVVGKTDFFCCYRFPPFDLLVQIILLMYNLQYLKKTISHSQTLRFNSKLVPHGASYTFQYVEQCVQVGTPRVFIITL